MPSKGLNIRITGDIKDFTAKMDAAVIKMKRVGKQMTKVGKQMSRNFSAPLAIIGGLSVKVFADFEQSMAKVQAVSGATGEEFQKLEQLAKDLGASTRFTAQEVAELELNYSKLGFIPAEIEQITGATLDLALATGEDLAQSATVAGATLRGFGLAAEEMPRVVDVMAKSFSSSALDLEKFSVAMPKVGAAAKSAGFTLEQTTALMGALVDRGLEASTAGTSLRKIFIELSKSGMTLDQALVQINNSEDKLGAAVKLFGDRAAIAAVQLAENQGAVSDLTTTLDNAQGSAKAMATTMDDTLQGSLFRMKSALEGAAITIGEILAPIISKIAAKIGEWANKFQGLSDGTKKVILIIGGLVAAIGPLLVVLGMLMTNVIPGLVTVFKALNVTMAANPIGMIALAVGALITTLVLLNKKTGVLRDLWAGIKQTFAPVVDIIKETLAAIKGLVRSIIPANTVGSIFQKILSVIANIIKFSLLIVIKTLAFIIKIMAKGVLLLVNGVKKVVKWFKDLANTSKIVSTAINIVKVAINKITEAFSWLGDKIRQALEWLGLIEEESKEVIKTKEELTEVTQEEAIAQEDSNKVTEDSIKGLKQQKEVIEDLTGNFEDLIKARRKLLNIPEIQGDRSGFKAKEKTTQPLEFQGKKAGVVLPNIPDATENLTELQQHLKSVKGRMEDMEVAGNTANETYKQLGETFNRLSNQEQFIESLRVIGDVVGDVADNFGKRLVDSLGLAESGFEGFLSGLLKTVTSLLSMMLAASISNAIAGATASGTATGPLAIFTTPAFIATAVGGVLAAFAAIPEFATGVENFEGGLAMVHQGEALVNLPRGTDVIPKSQVGGMGGTQVFIPNVRIKGSDLLIVFDRAERQKNKVV
jgi:hypothetical protein